MTERERKDQHRARILEKAGCDFEIKRDGQIVRSQKTYDAESWADHLEEQKRRLEIRLKAASTEADKTRIRRELRSWELMEKFTNSNNDFRKETRAYEGHYD